MPRGSKPGERRGGRQRGTPNKKTALQNAAIAAAAANPNLSPLDFLLNLMRDETTPPDLRLQIAQTAAPYLHDKPGRGDASRRPKPINGMAVVGFNGLTKFRTRAQTGASGNGAVKPQGQAIQEGAYFDLSPLEVMLELMNDPGVPAPLRVKAARAMVPFTRPKRKTIPRPDPEARTYLEGFIIDPELAAAFRDDCSRQRSLHNKAMESKNGRSATDAGGDRGTRPARGPDRATATIGRTSSRIRITASLQKDEERLRREYRKGQFFPKSPGLTPAEEIQVLQIKRTSKRRSRRPRTRGAEPCVQLSDQSVIKEGGLGPAETSGSQAIEVRYPGISLDEFPLRIPSAAFVRAFDVAQGRPPRKCWMTPTGRASTRGAPQGGMRAGGVVTPAG